MKIYDIPDDYRAFFRQLLADPGADPHVVSDTLEAMGESLAHSQAHLIARIKEIKAEAKAIDDEAGSVLKQGYSLRKQASERAERAERLQLLLERNLAYNGLDRAGTGIHTARYQNNPPRVDLLCSPDELPDEWCRIDRKPDRTKMKEAIESGEQLNFCQLVQERRLVVK